MQEFLKDKVSSSGIFLKAGRVDTNHINDEDEVDKGSEHDAAFFKTGEDAPEAFQSAEQALNFIAPLRRVIFRW